MNRTSRTDEPLVGDGYNQNPNPLSNDLTTNQDLNGTANARELRGDTALSIHSQGNTSDQEAAMEEHREPDPDHDPESEHQRDGQVAIPRRVAALGRSSTERRPARANASSSSGLPPSQPNGNDCSHGRAKAAFHHIKSAVVKFGKFVGPGFMIAVAYIDPGNYSTDIAAGATYQFRLLFIVLLANVFAIFLQNLAIKLGTVSGLNLAEACRAFLPRWLNYALYALAEIAIIATDMAEVIGTAIALNLLIPQLPLVAGCALSILDVMIILFFYQPNGSMRRLRAFEAFVVLLVFAVAICFCIQLSLIQDTSVGDVFMGYLPSTAIIQQQGLYQACGILGATVMPHSLYLGSGIVQSRLRDFDNKSGLLPPISAPPASSSSSTNEGGIPDNNSKFFYIPSLSAIRYSMKYSIAELSLSLLTFALFVNSAILIVAGASLYGTPGAASADIFAIHELLTVNLAPAAGTVFALALLLSGTSAGIVCTIAGQMVSEGALNWRLKPWLRRLITRSISVGPSIIIAGAVGREGLDAALNGSQVVLSVVLPFVTAPLIWFTCLNRYMAVRTGGARFGIPSASTVTEMEEIGVSRRDDDQRSVVKMANAWWVAVIAVLVWVAIAALNLANIALLVMGQ